MTIRMLLTPALAVLLSLCASCTTNTLPTAAQLDAYERQMRAAARSEYAVLEQQRDSGELTQSDYEVAVAQLDHRVQGRVDTMAWNRHALAQSELKAMGIPTPDQPVANPPPGGGQIQGSLHNSMRTTGMGMMPSAGGASGGGFNLGGNQASAGGVGGAVVP